MPTRDPIRSATRRSKIRRRFPPGAACHTCGETSPLALIPYSEPLICAECERVRNNQSTRDWHHPAGSANHDLTVPIPVNAHRSRLSESQYDWPSRTLRNRHRSRLLAAAACIRGLIDMMKYLLDELGRWIPEYLESLDTALMDEFGEEWPKKEADKLEGEDK